MVSLLSLRYLSLGINARMSVIRDGFLASLEGTKYFQALHSGRL